MKPRKIAMRFGMFLIGIILAAATALVLGAIVMALWNWLMPEIFGLPTIGYWQGWGLVLLAHILFKVQPGRGRHGRHGFRSKSDWKSGVRKRMRRRFGDEEGGAGGDPDRSEGDNPDAESPGR